MPKILKDMKSEIIIEAKKIVEEEGLSALTIRRIASTLNIAIGTIYNYFPNKTALSYELFSIYWNDILNKIDQMKGEELYHDLKTIYQELYQIIMMFTGIFTAMYNQQSSKKHRDEMFGQIARKLVTLLEKSNQSFDMDVFDLGNWITLNMVMMSHVKMVKYDVFEKMLYKVFK